MKIGFDAKRFFNNFTGLGNYSRFVVDALSKFAPENEYLLYSPRVNNHAEITQLLSRSNIKVITPPSRYRFFSSLWRTWGISKEPSVKTLNLFHGLSQELPINLPPTVKKIVTVHDLIFIRSPKLYNPVDVAIYKSKVKAACRNADKILATSQQTAADIIDFLKIDPTKIEVVYQGCHANFKKKFSPIEIDAIKVKYSLPQKYILNVGTIEERKNVLILVKALALLPKELRWHVVIVGRATAYKKQVVDQAHQLGVTDWVIFLHNIPFEHLPLIYQGAEVFVYPSLFEGFGIPLVEALESSVPVITSSGSCFSEAAGPGAIYVNPLSEEELVFHLKRVLKDDELRQQMIITGTKHLAHFEPDVISKNLNRIYTSL